MAEKKKQRQSMISVRGGFSDENNMGSVTHTIQIDELDNRTRIILSNKLRILLEEIFEKDIGLQYFSDQYSLPNRFCRSILSDVFIRSINLSEGEIYNWRRVYDNVISAVFTQAPYNEVLDIIWYICDWFIRENPNTQKIFSMYFNDIFERECVGYDRENKDYKNCVKESISAVEAICKIIADEPNSDLSKAIKHLKKGGIHIHPTLESAWEKIYAYTCDVGGIRHAEKLFESDVTFEEAKYMLISCSAFVNYLIAEYGKVKNDEKQRN